MKGKTIKAVAIGVMVISIVVASGLLKYHLEGAYIRHHVGKSKGAWVALDPGDKVEWIDMVGQRNVLTMKTNGRGIQETWLNDENLPKPLTEEEFRRAQEEIRKRIEADKRKGK